MEDYPNVMIIPANDETPENIVEDYVEMIKYTMERGESLEELLYDFFDDVNRWSCKQFLIDSAKESLQELENIHKIDMQYLADDEEFADDLDDEDYLI